VGVFAGVAAEPSWGARQQAGGDTTQDAAILLSPHVLVSRLGERLAGTRIVAAARPVTGGQTVLPIIGRMTTAAGVPLLRVMLPGRPNGSTGWIRQEGTTEVATSWRIVVRILSRRVLVYHDGVLARSFLAMVGRPSTPTPRGEFFVEESVRMPSASAGAPYALALNGHSDALRHFDGGPGQIAIHGVAHLNGILGTAGSHGCVRLATPAIRWLAARIAPGVRVTITR
jgi:hypothetical protein